MSRRFRLKSLLIACCGLLGALAVACADEDSGGEGEGTTKWDPEISIWEFMDVEDPQPDETLYQDTASPYEDAAGCKAFENAFPEIHDCMCDKCFDVQQQCDALEGCREIAQCGIEIGCTDAYSCYLTPADAKCVPIIDKWGNTGLAAAVSLALSACSVEQQCRTTPAP